MSLLKLLTNTIEAAMFGYPMQRICFSGFTDIISGEPVYRYRGSNGKTYLATGPWALFRVEIKE